MVKEMMPKIPTERFLSMLLGVSVALLIVTPAYVIKKQLTTKKEVPSINASEVIKE